MHGQFVSHTTFRLVFIFYMHFVQFNGLILWETEQRQEKMLELCVRLTGQAQTKYTATQW